MTYYILKQYSIPLFHKIHNTQKNNKMYMTINDFSIHVKLSLFLVILFRHILSTDILDSYVKFRQKKNEFM